MVNKTEGQSSKTRAKFRAQKGGLALFAFFARSLQQIAALIITLLAARFLLPVEYGVYTLSIVFVTLIQTISYTGFYHFIVTQKGDDRAVLATSFWMLVGLAFAFSALFAALSKPIAWFFDAPDLALVLFLLCLLQPFAGVTAWYSAVLLRRQRVSIHFFIIFAQNALALVIGAAVLIMWQSIFALVVFRAVRVGSALILSVSLSKDHPQFSFDRKLARDAFAYSAKLYGSKFLNFLTRFGGDLILGLVYTTAEAGLYRFGNRVASGATDIVTQPMSSFALTQFGARNRDDKPIGPVLQRFVGVTILLVGAVSSVILVLGEAIVTAFFRPEYLAALTVTYAIALRGMMGFGIQFLTPLLSARDQTGLLLRFEMVTAFVTVGMIIAIAPFGLSALAWTQTGLTLFATIAAFWVMHRFSQIDITAAVRAACIATSLCCLYCLALFAIWLFAIVPSDLGETLKIVLGLVTSMALFILLVVVGRIFKVFSLQIFAG